MEGVWKGVRGWKFVGGGGMTREYGREKVMHKLHQNNLYSLDGIEPLECILMWGGGGVLSLNY